MNHLLGCCLGLLLTGPALARQTIAHEALVDGGRNAGHAIVEQGAEGITHVDVIFKDNGRGPEARETESLAPGGIAVGKRADLILVDDDPTVHMPGIRKVALVLKCGNAGYPDDIDTALGGEPSMPSIHVQAE